MTHFEEDYDDLYSPDELRIGRRAREFAAERLEPQSEDIDAGGRCRELMSELGKEGLLGTTVPTSLGGHGLSSIHNSLISEELSAVAPSLAAMRGVSDVFVGAPLLGFGSASQHEQWLRPMAEGKRTYSLGITEPTAGSDASGIITTARAEGDAYVIDGLKHYISGAAENDAILAYVATDPSAPPRERFSAIMVPTSSEGLKAEPISTTGLRGFSHARLQFDGVEVPASHRIGEEGQGLEILLSGLVPERIDIAARALGCARRAQREAVEHAAKREQFGQTISRFQAVSHRLADMRLWLEAARLLIIRAARRHTDGLPCDKEAAEAKLFATERAFQICDDAMQTLGARGYTTGHVVDLMFRDVRALRFGGGTDDIMRHVIQREEFVGLKRSESELG